MPDETEHPSPKKAPRIDSAQTPILPELFMGRIPMESGWHYELVQKDSVEIQTFPRTLQPSGVQIPGWEVVKGQKPAVRRADDTSDPTVARHMDTFVMRIRQEHYDAIIANERIKHDAKQKQLRTAEVDPAGGILMENSIRFSQ